jgi:hypothetical protein
MSGNIPKIKTFRVGPRNKRLEEASSDGLGYSVIVETDVPMAELLERNSIEIIPEETRITPENFPWTSAGQTEKYFELFDFSFRSDYGRSGVDEAFVREKLEFFKFNPATLVDLICFAGHLREAHKDHWFESRTIVGLGSVLTTSQVVKKAGLFNKEVRATYRHYPEIECVSGRPLDQLRLYATEKDKDGNWPTNVLFLATTMV